MINKNTESPRRTKNLKYLRISNRAEIIRCLSIQGPISRIELARQLGLTKMAISSIVSEMIDEGLILEQGAHAAGDKSRAVLPVNPSEVSSFSVPEELFNTPPGSAGRDAGGRVRATPSRRTGRRAPPAAGPKPAQAERNSARRSPPPASTTWRSGWRSSNPGSSGIIT